MDERFVKKLLVPSFVILVLSTVFFYELKNLIDLTFFKNKHILIIGILSAPDNFEQRLSIRKTWLQLLSDISGSAYFIIGNEICEIPPEDRADPYSCIYKPFSLPQNVTTDTEFTTMKIRKESKTSVPSYIGFSFYVRDKILVKKLGILKELLYFFNSEVQVKLVSAFNNQVLASATFGVHLLNDTTSKVITKAIKPVSLVTTYEAYVKVEGNNQNINFYHDCGIAAWENKPNVINFLYLWQEDSVIPKPFSEKSCTFVFMTYSIIDLKNMKDHISNKITRQRQWEKLNYKLSEQLQNESRTFNDLLFFDVVDVYRNLTLKMLHFYRRLVETEYFHYVLKTDDDSFIDLLRVHNQLVVVNKEMDSEILKVIGQVKEAGQIARIRLSVFWWWSFFKEYWKVQHSGKWREDYYGSASYPTFPCGGGYVINKGIVDYIVSNFHNLNHFQGEDVSLGIWLSSLPVIQYKTPGTVFRNNSNTLQKKILKKFKDKTSCSQNKSLADKMAPDYCEWTCSNKKVKNAPFCNKVQMSVDDMYNTWSEYTQNGFL